MKLSEDHFELSPQSATGASSKADSSACGSSAEPHGERLGPITTSRISLLRYAPGLLLVLIAIADAGQLTDPDLWGHIRFGQAVLAAHHLITHDVYSYTAYGHQWRNHEWLTEIIMALFYNAFGVVGLKIWKFACSAATIIFLAMGEAETGAPPSIQLNTLTIAAVAIMPQMEFRPQLFTFALFALLLYLLARYHYRGSAPLWLAIPIMMFWANLHGGFIIGIVTLCAYAGMVGLQDLYEGRGLAHGLRLGALAVAGTLATLVTPYGIEIWEAVVHALNDPITRDAITDWQPLIYAMVSQWDSSRLGVIYYLCVLGLMAAMLLFFYLEPRGDDLPFVAIAFIMSIGAFISVRNMPLAVIACVGPIVRHAALTFSKRRGNGNATAGLITGPQRSGVNQWFSAAAALFVIVFAGLFSPRLQTNGGYPSGAVEFMKEHHLHGNVLADFGWGEYMIWHDPQSKVFIDGRYDTVYPLSVIRDYVDFYFDLPDAKKALSNYPNDFVLIPPYCKAYRMMASLPGWKLIYTDPNSALFVKADSAAAKLESVPLIGHVPPKSYFP